MAPVQKGSRPTDEEYRLLFETLEQNLRDTRLLRDLAVRPISSGNAETLYLEVLAAAIRVTRADAGTVQILDRDTHDLVLLATQGFDDSMTAYLHRCPVDSLSSWNRALAARERIIVDYADIAASEPGSTAKRHLEGGFRSAQSTPLVSRRGESIGIVSTHWRRRHRPSERDLQFLDLLARQVADLIEQRQIDAALREARDRLEARVKERTKELADVIDSLQAEVLERRAAEEQVRTLFKRLVSAQEDERRRIARDLHDQVGQQITALRINLESLRTDLTPGTPVAEHARRAQQLAVEIDESVDFLTWELLPASLDRLGLAAALPHLVSGWSQRFGIATECHVTGMEDVRLSADADVNLYRIVQEALHNAYKHAEPSRVAVFLGRQGDRVVMVIEDDGKGFDPDAVRKPEEGRGLGMVSMRERAALVRGEIEIESAPGQGTAVFVRAPLVPR